MMMIKMTTITNDCDGDGVHDPHHRWTKSQLLEELGLTDAPRPRDTLLCWLSHQPGLEYFRYVSSRPLCVPLCYLFDAAWIVQCGGRAAVLAVVVEGRNYHTPSQI